MKDCCMTLNEKNDLNILFIVPKFANQGQYYSFPYGMGYVIASMKRHGFTVSCLNTCHNNAPLENQIKEKISKKNIDIVCTGGMSAHWNLIRDVVTCIKDIKPAAITIVGGAIITSDPELALKNIPIDYGIVGEGEETCPELVDALIQDKNILSVKGIVFVRDSRVILTEQRPPIKDLNSLPFPDYEALEFEKWLEIETVEKGGLTGLLFNIDERPRVAEISASRSCPFKCTFCFHPLGNVYRQRSLDNVFEEIEYLKQRYNISLLNVLDELFSSDESRVREFVRRINILGIYWNAQMRVDTVTVSLLKALKDSKLIIMGLGVESLSDTVLNSMNKRITKTQIEHAYNLCSSMGVRTGSNIIFGDVAETEQTIKESMTWWHNHREHDLNIRFLLAIPNSHVWKYAIKNGKIKNKLKHIIDMFPVVNLTQIEDTKFNKIYNNIIRAEFRFKYFTLGNVLSSERTIAKYNGKTLYRFSVQCPYCHQISVYEYYRYTSNQYSIVLCKHCYKRLKIPSKLAFIELFYRSIITFLYHKLYEIYWFDLRKYKPFRTFVQKTRNILSH